jgi:hypothetical protein
MAYIVRSAHRLLRNQGGSENLDVFKGSSSAASLDPSSGHRSAGTPREVSRHAECLLGVRMQQRGSHWTEQLSGG